MKPFTDAQRKAAEAAMIRVHRPVYRDTLKLPEGIDPRTAPLRAALHVAYIARAWKLRREKPALTSTVLRFGGASRR